jgi:hypothetical protein
MQDDPPVSDTSTKCQCPACGALVERSSPQTNLLQCPDCGEQFFVADDETAADSISREEADARAAAELEAKREAELSEMRIHQIAQLRRTAMRSRSWFTVGVLTCWIGGLLLIVAAVTDWHRGLRFGPISDIVLALVAARLLPYFRRRIRALSAEISESRLEEPLAPPDLSTLSDGSQQLQRLEEMAGKDTHDSSPSNE